MEGKGKWLLLWRRENGRGFAVGIESAIACGFTAGQVKEGIQGFAK